MGGDVIALRNGPVRVEGRVEAGFEPLRQVFEQSFQREEWGASFAVFHEGRLVVDLWGGLADQGAAKPWQADTITTVFSATKGLVALCFLMLTDRGRLDCSAPIAEYWPAFGTQDKRRITVAMLLNHRSGLLALDRPLSLELLEAPPEELARVLEAQTPRWEPGSDQGYHAVTYGLYAQEVFRRVAGETLGSFLAREVAQPLQADVHLGLPAELEPRVAVNYPATTLERVFKILPKLFFHTGLEGRVYRQVALGRDAARAIRHPQALGMRGIQNFNLRRIRALELPWVNAVANARGLARVYGALANGGSLDGHRLVRPRAVEAVMDRHSWSQCDRVLRKPIGWSLGFLKEEAHMFSPNTESFGHAGAGGALGWCDPKQGLAIGYTTNKMDHRVRSKRALTLCRATYACLGR